MKIALIIVGNRGKPKNIPIAHLKCNIFIAIYKSGSERIAGWPLCLYSRSTTISKDLLQEAQNIHYEKENEKKVVSCE